MGGTIEEIAEEASRLLASISPDFDCVPQEWDNRIDCCIKMPDGSVVGEMILLSDASEKRFLEAADRLRKRQMGVGVHLENELWSPILIQPSK